MDQYDIGARSVYILSQCVNYASDEEARAGEASIEGRIDRARQLWTMLDDWKNHLSVHFQSLPLEGSRVQGQVFRPIWIHPPNFAAAMQNHNFARILLLIHQPGAGGFREYQAREGKLNEAIDVIGGIATTMAVLPDQCDAPLITSTRCLYGAGLYCQGDDRRDRIVDLLATHQQRTGWPVIDLGEELRSEWAKTGKGGL